MKAKLRSVIHAFTVFMEYFISLCIISMIIAFTVLMIKDYVTTPSLILQEDALAIFLQRILSLVIGVEFVKMLVQHKPENVIDVLIFATSRQMIVTHTDGLETILLVVAIAILFTISRFIIRSNGEDDEDIISD